MKTGEKIRRARKKLGLTQEALAGEQITSNMLSKIENDVATPSLDTLKYIANTLSLPLGYLLSEDDDLSFFEKKAAINDIYSAYSHQKYLSAIQRAKRIEKCDNELAYILADCYFNEGLASLRRGSIESAKRLFTECESMCKSTLLDTSHFEVKIPMYKAICQNINAPLLEFNPDSAGEALLNSAQYEYFKYITLDYEYSYKIPAISAHIEAKKLIKERNYKSAIEYLLKAADLTKLNGYDAYTIFGIYSDLEICYKQLYDFEKAYLYASKKLSLIEGFKS